MSHDDTHEAAILEVAFADAEPTSEVLAQLTQCDECLAVLARALEDVTILGPLTGARVQRLAAILDEVVVWRAVVDDVGEASARMEIVAGAVQRRGKGDT